MGQWWPLCVAIHLVIACFATSPAQLKEELLRKLEVLRSEEDAKAVLEPYLDDLKQLDAAVVEKVVFKQWWNLAQDIIAKSHLQKIDLSFAVRKATRRLKDESDELLRTLNPKYGQAQLVSPAFQWAQNDTCIFLTVKFTVRWNAPGALEVTEPAVHIQGNRLNFTGVGKHSNNKYKYQLSLKFFDNLSPEDSTWSTASVGKLSATLRKKWSRKWSRLLQDKKQKIQNMHVWMETQDRISGQMGGMNAVSHSPVTCADIKKLYCSVTDSCKLPGDCSQCPGKSESNEAEHICGGAPTQRASVSFKDVDFDKDEYGGTIKISKAQHDYETESFTVYWGKDASTPIDIDGRDSVVAEVSARSSNGHVSLDFNTKKPEHATHLLVFSKNAYGEHLTPGSDDLKDAYLPLTPPKGIKFEDDNGDKGEIKGDVLIEPAENQDTIGKYSLYWGKSSTHRIDKKKNISSFLLDIGKEANSYFMGDTRYPEQATHLLLYSKNEHGEHPTPVAVKIVDNLAPCQHKGDDDCPSGLSVTALEDGKIMVSVKKAKLDAGITAYLLHWGKASCDEEGASASNGHLQYLTKDGSLDYQLEGATHVAPDGTSHILVFSQNKWGDSKICVSERYVGAVAPPRSSHDDSTQEPLDDSEVAEEGYLEPEPNEGDEYPEDEQLESGAGEEL